MYYISFDFKISFVTLGFSNSIILFIAGGVQRSDGATEGGAW